ncbi:MAG: nitroreductase family protein [Rubrivivax sp.]|nr:nitroreductase family protein [Rubrivivax sp.]MDP3084830.1 nitroreductase family protein [Rubrivivax sp.]
MQIRAAAGPSGLSTTTEASAADEVFANAEALICSRRNVSPKRLLAPGPSAAQLQSLLALAAAAPDHGQLTPWRFIVVPAAQRHRLAEVFAQALIDRDPDGASAAQVQAARDKAHRAPLLLVAVARLGQRDPDISTLERMVSMGAAIQNLLLGAHALGFGAGLTSGQAMGSPRLRALLGLADGETAVCCVNVGTIGQHKSGPHARPQPADFVSELGS